jgi:hypothetical protein
VPRYPVAAGLGELDCIMMTNWLVRIWMRWDVRRIIRDLTSEQRELLRATPESGLILFHHGFGTGLRNGFRHGRYRGLMSYCYSAVKRSDQPMSFDALSSVAIHVIWKALQSGT